MDIGPEVYAVFVLVVILLAAMKYDDRKRAKRDAENQHNAPTE